MSQAYYQTPLIFRVLSILIQQGPKTRKELRVGLNGECCGIYDVVNRLKEDGLVTESGGHARNNKLTYRDKGWFDLANNEEWR